MTPEQLAIWRAAVAWRHALILSAWTVYMEAKRHA